MLESWKDYFSSISHSSGQKYPYPQHIPLEERMALIQHELNENKYDYRKVGSLFGVTSNQIKYYVRRYIDKTWVKPKLRKKLKENTKLSFFSSFARIRGFPEDLYGTWL